MNNFGTDGIRGQVGTGLLTFDNLHFLGKAIAIWAQKKYGQFPHILLAHDTRISCSFIKAALKTGLLLLPIKISDGGILPTPAMAQLLNYGKNFNIGIMISASHNPFEDNGIKIIDGISGKLTEEDEIYISQLLLNLKKECDYKNLGYDTLLPKALNEYNHLTSSYFKPNFLVGKKIVLDTAHGATYKSAPSIFKKLGAQVITINNTPNGININQQCGAVYPQNLQKTVMDNKADIGFAFDGDGDRVIAISKKGIIKDGDDLLAILLNHPNYNKSQIIVGTVMTNQGLENYLKNENKKLVRVAVGDKYVAQKLKDLNLFLGGEQSGHIILRDLNFTGDGILAALKVCEALEFTNNWIMKTFVKYPQITINIPVKLKKDLDQKPFLDIISEAQSYLDKGRLLVRYSGTESYLRIMVEEIDPIKAYNIAYNLSQNLQKALP